MSRMEAMKEMRELLAHDADIKPPRVLYTGQATEQEKAYLTYLRTRDQR